MPFVKVKEVVINASPVNKTLRPFTCILGRLLPFIFKFCSELPVNISLPEPATLAAALTSPPTITLVLLPIKKTALPAGPITSCAFVINGINNNNAPANFNFIIILCPAYTGINKMRDHCAAITCIRQHIFINMQILAVFIAHGIPNIRYRRLASLKILLHSLSIPSMRSHIFSFVTICSLALISLPAIIHAQQGVSINASGTPANASAMLDISATNKGLLIPRMTSAQKVAIAAPAKGLLVYQTDVDSGFYYYTGNRWVGIVASDTSLKSAWLLGGNAKTTDAKHFIGTTDDVPLNIRVNNQLSGWLDPDNGNTFFGYQAGMNKNITNVTAIGYQAGTKNQVDDNFFVGTNAGFSNTAGSNNFFNGNGAGASNVDGSFNHFAGIGAGGSTTSGNQNHFEGYQAGTLNTLGSGNQFIGYNAGNFNTTGNNNMLIGNEAGGANNTGSSNQFIGYYAGRFNTQGAHNLLVGYKAGYTQLTAKYNTIIGDSAGYANTGSSQLFVGYSAGAANTSGALNLFIGTQAGFKNTTGSGNFFIGYATGGNNIGGGNNTFIGHMAGFYNTSGVNNLFTGLQAGYNNTSGAYNTFLGYQAGENNTSASNNIFVGFQAGNNNTTGAQNMAIGFQSGYFAKTPSYNFFNGYQSGYNDTTGAYNHFEGYQSGYKNGTGNNNTFIGYQTGYNNAKGSNNVAIGYLSAYAKNVGNNNTFLGYSAGYGNSADENTFIGSYAAYGNYSGRRDVALGNNAFFSGSGQDNVVIGHNAGLLMGNSNQNVIIGHATLNYNMTSLNYGVSNMVVIGDSAGFSSVARSTIAIGSNSAHFYQGQSSVFVGDEAGKITTGGYYNTYVGAAAGLQETNGFDNTFLGASTGWTNKTGNGLTLLGEQADVSSSALFNSIAIGQDAIVTASNKAVIGNTNMTSIGGKVGWSTFSDGRFKRNIQENVPGLQFILKLRPVTYNYDNAKLNAFFGVKEKRPGKNTSQNNFTAVAAANDNIQYTGFVAQEVQAAARQVGYDFSGVDKPGNDNDLYALRYSDFVAPLVKAVQEQQQQIETLKKKNQDMQATLDDLLKRIQLLELKGK